MPADFSGIWLKIRRAQHHLDDLKEQARDFIERGCYGTFEAHFDPAQQCHVFVFNERKPVPAEWGVILGDVLHNARSALDHLVWQLVRANGERPGVHSAFPICVSETAWKRNITERDPQRGPSPLAGISTKSLALIADKQPWTNTTFPDPKRLPLAVLARFNNTDKHSVIHGAVTYLADGGAPGVEISPPLIATVNWARYATPGTLLEHGAEVAWAQVAVLKAIKNPQMNVNLNLPTSVAFGESGTRDAPPIIMFGKIIEEVSAIVTEAQVLLA